MASVYVLTVGGVTRTMQEKSLRIREAANRISTISFSIVSMDGSVLPAIGEEVILTEDGVRIFGGHIDTPSRGNFNGTTGGRTVRDRQADDSKVNYEQRA